MTFSEEINETENLILMHFRFLGLDDKTDADCIENSSSQAKPYFV